jgi:hypothetical protein
MADTKEGMGSLTQHMSAVDDDMNKSGHVEEKAVASVALGKSTSIRKSLPRLPFVPCTRCEKLILTFQSCCSGS